MIKEVIFCDVCGQHVHDNTSVSFYLVHGMTPTVDTRKAERIKSDVKDTDVTFCETCELDIYAILQSRAVKHRIENDITG